MGAEGKRLLRKKEASVSDGGRCGDVDVELSRFLRKLRFISWTCFTFPAILELYGV